MKDSIKRPLLRYHGGKWRLASWIISHFPDHDNYVEPFGGAGSVLLRKERSPCEVYNDLDGEIVNLFRMTRERGSELRFLLTLTPWAREEYLLSYTLSSDPLEQARRTVVRSFMGFGSNSLNRSVKSGFRARCIRRDCSTGVADWKNYPEALAFIIERLRGVIIEQRNALEVINQQDDPETLFYCDPPYHQSTRSKIMYQRGYRHEMTERDHIQLADKLHAVKGKVIISNYSSPLYNHLYRGWKRIKKHACADGGRKRIEVLWIKK